MCGIVGFVDFSKKSDVSTIQNMANVLSHRGPDDSGYYFESTDKFTLGLGQRRLSVIDLSSNATQPMSDESGRFTIIYNGEVYNYRAIRKILLDLKYTFNSDSDTEVVLKAFIQWGIKSLDYLNGMFSFSIYDQTEKKIFIVRDRLGVKPLYYYWQNDLFLFASELKSFHCHSGFIKIINAESVYSFLQYTYIPDPNSIFINTFKLEPGHYLYFDINRKNIEISQYWSALDVFNRPKLDYSFAKAKEELEDRLCTACNYRMISDVPVGLFLSGGYDSSLVAALLQKDRRTKIKTFTVGFFDQKYNEAVYAKSIAKHIGTDHHDIYCTVADVKNIIPNLSSIFDEPFADSSAIPSVLLSQFAKKHVSVVLSADGGDELFAGYKKYVNLLSIKKNVTVFPHIFRKIASEGIKNIFDLLPADIRNSRQIKIEILTKYLNYLDGSLSFVDLANLSNQTLPPGSIKKFINRKYILSESFSKNRHELEKFVSPLSSLLALDYVSYLPGDILTKVDRSTMSASLEAREPLLDYSLIEWAAALPDHFKTSKSTTKYILKEIAYKYIPETLLNRPKMGFSVPVKYWFRSELKYYFDIYLSKNMIDKHEFINSCEVQNALARYYAGEDSEFPFLWSMLIFQLWFEKWM